MTHCIYVPVTLRILCVIRLIHTWHKGFNGLCRANTTLSIRMTWLIHSFYAWYNSFIRDTRDSTASVTQTWFVLSEWHDTFYARYDSFICDTRNSTATSILYWWRDSFYARHNSFIRDAWHSMASAALPRNGGAVAWLIVFMYSWLYVFFVLHDSFLRDTRDSTASAAQTWFILSKWHDTFYARQDSSYLCTRDITYSLRDTTHS